MNQQLFCPHVSMRQFMWQNDLPQLARFVIECLEFWQPHNAQASEVVKCRACQAVAWLPVWWHARERHCPGTDPLGGGLGATLQQFAWPEALQSFLFALQWTIVTMFSTNATIYHHLISQAGWNRCNQSIYISALLYFTLHLFSASLAD